MPLPTLLRAISLRLSSPSENSFILHIHFPGEMTYINTLIDSGASVNFIDLALASKYPLLRHLLQKLIDLELFDGELTSGGSITHDLMTPILYANGVQHTVTFHETKLHHSNPIVLGLKWLRDIKPDVDWASLSLAFWKERLTGAIPMFHLEKDYKPTIEEVPDKDYPMQPPREGPLFPDNNETKPTPTKSPKVPPNPTLKDTQKDQWFPVLKDMPWDDSYPTLLDDSFPTLKDAPLNPNIDIKIIGAAPFARLIQEGIEVYQLHISPVSPHETLCVEQTHNSKKKKTEQEILDEVVSPEYHDFANIFSEGEAKTLPPHQPYNHKIDLEEGMEPPFGKIYNMSETELKLLKDYIDDMLGKGFIQPSSSAASAPVLFANGSLWLCIDYCSLNRITKKNCYPIPLINDLIDKLKDTKVYMKINLRAVIQSVTIHS